MKDAYPFRHIFLDGTITYRIIPHLQQLRQTLLFIRKHNWRRKLGSHPDWYNNVYDHNWDFASENIQTRMPGLQVMWAFQLIGKAAANKTNNFNDWSYNGSNWWSGVGQNLAGGGQVNPAGGGQALVNGNPDLYLMNWTADSTTYILKHWFGPGGLGLDKFQFVYWSMDNEPEIWNGTHDDVMPSLLSASAFMDSYFAVAKKARERFPQIKLTGPVPANEWQWYRWGEESLSIDGKSYCWLEYFIKRVADEQKRTGIRLLDVLDVHLPNLQMLTWCSYTESSMTKPMYIRVPTG